MSLFGKMMRGCTALIIAAMIASPAGATVLMRADLEDLVAGNELIVVGEVVDTFSYWNVTGTFILTDVRLLTTEVLQGSLTEREVTITLMGGTVGDLSTIIVGGAELEPGISYVLFLNKENLPGADHVLTVRDHCQGAFNLVRTADGLRAISQANTQPLAPGRSGQTEAAGGEEGFPLDSMRQSIRDIEERLSISRQEVS